jgi:hypothetical protein
MPGYMNRPLKWTGLRRGAVIDEQAAADLLSTALQHGIWLKLMSIRNAHAIGETSFTHRAGGQAFAEERVIDEISWGP